MEDAVQRVSTIVVGERDRTRVFHSAAEMPVCLRRRMERAIGSDTSATLLIADEGGRREILRKMEGYRSPLESRLLGSVLSRTLPSLLPEEQPRIQWVRLGAILAVAGSLLLIARTAFRF
jgi:hypothetical protein